MVPKRQHPNSLRRSDPLKRTTAGGRAARATNGFLLRVGKRRDSKTFAREFAEWLSDECRCRNTLVRLCFDAGVTAFQSKLAKRLYSGRILRRHRRYQQLRARASRGNTKQGKKWLKKAKHILPLSQRRADHRIAKIIGKKVEIFRQKQISKLTHVLAQLHPYSQINRLKKLLRGHRSIPTACKKLKITHEDIQAEFYSAHPELKRREQLRHDLEFQRHLGGALAESVAQQNHIPGQAFWLYRLGPALAGSARIVQLLCEEYERDAPALHLAVRDLTTSYLRFLATRDSRSLKRGIRGVRKRSPNYSLIRRMALLDEHIVGALWDFFSHGLDWSYVVGNPGLLTKMLGPFCRDVPTLLKFLFQRGRNKKPGLIPQWLEDSKDQSLYRRKRDFLASWEWQIEQSLAGVSEHEYALKVEAMSGLPAPAPGSVEAFARADAFRKLRSRTFKLGPPC